MKNRIGIEVYLREFAHGDLPILDVRSESEYLHGHVPGAINLPLLNDEQRHLVGIRYKEAGQSAAVELGFELTGHLFHEYIKRARELAPNARIFLYCWRGGLRSNIMAWLLTIAGFEVNIIEDGYKSYRRLALKVFESSGNFVVLSGATGTGKTEMLHRLKNHGEIILDLEMIASHKGSAFGSLGQNPQPTQEHFENLIAAELFHNDSARMIWTEHESRMIGKLRIPDAVFNRMQSAPIVLIERSFDNRKSRILNEYGKFSNESLAAQTALLNRRLGFDNVKFALDALAVDDKNTWVDILLNYYDKSYQFAFEKQAPKDVVSIDADHLDDGQLTDAILSMKESIISKA